MTLRCSATPLLGPAPPARSFLFWQQYDDSPEGQKYCRLYLKSPELPHIGPRRSARAARARADRARADRLRAARSTANELNR